MKRITRIFSLVLAMLLVLAAPALAFEELSQGSQGNAVVKLQNKLNELGYAVGTADGVFGKKTESAVQEFQKANGLAVTGIADAQTQELLYSDTNAGSSGDEAVSELVEFKSMMMESVSEQISSAGDLTTTEDNRAILAALLSLEFVYQCPDYSIDYTLPIFVGKQGDVAVVAIGGADSYVWVFYQSDPLYTGYGILPGNDPAIVKAALEVPSESVWTVSMDTYQEKLAALNEQLSAQVQ